MWNRNMDLNYTIVENGVICNNATASGDLDGAPYAFPVNMLQ